MTPCGHVAVAYLAGKASRKIVMPSILIGGILPDIDFILIPFPWFNQIHRGFSHSLVFLGVFALLAGFVSSSRRVWPGSSSGQGWQIVMSLFFGGLLHLLVDACLDNNPSNGIGVAFFWPFSEEYFSPFHLLQAQEIQKLSWEHPVQFLRSSLWIIFLEVPFYFVAAGVYVKGKYFT
jgi:membrane-bound metal-dependent hydrolase YbcI (DUF457 family)